MLWLHSGSIVAPQWLHSDRLIDLLLSPVVYLDLFKYPCVLLDGWIYLNILVWCSMGGSI